MTASCHREPAAIADEPVGDELDLSIALDLRRRQPRPVVETLLALARHATREDRSLIEAIFGEGRTLIAVAACTGERPRTLRRRLRRVISRLIDPRFAFVAMHRGAWPQRRRLVATLHIIQARTLRDTARRLGITEHAVRREICAIDVLFSQQASPFPTHPAPKD